MLREILIFSFVFLFGSYLIQCDVNSKVTQDKKERGVVNKDGKSGELSSTEDADRISALRKSFGVTDAQADGGDEEEIPTRVKRGWGRRRKRKRKRRRKKKKKKYEADKVAYQKLHVAYYMQHFKLFGYLNGKHIKRVQYSKKYWWRDWKYAFPTQPTVRLDLQLEEICEQSAEKCMKAVQNISIGSTMYRQFWKKLEKGKLLKKLKYVDSYAQYSTIDPFGRVKEEYIYRATALYYLCWWTMQEAEYLKHMGVKGAEFGAGGCQAFGMKDYRADDSRPWGCAEFSFCPDPCCDPGKEKHKDAIKKVPREAYKNDGTSMWPQNEHDCRARKGNPCWSIGNGACRLDRARNRNLQDLMRNKLNVTCDCNTMMPGYKWYQPVRGCVDENECQQTRPGNKSVCPDHTMCRNNQGAYSCECKKHYSEKRGKTSGKHAGGKTGKPAGGKTGKHAGGKAGKTGKHAGGKAGKTAGGGSGKPAGRAARDTRENNAPAPRKPSGPVGVKGNNQAKNKIPKTVQEAMRATDIGSIEQNNRKLFLRIKRARRPMSGEEIRRRVKRGWGRRRKRRKRKGRKRRRRYKKPPPPEPQRESKPRAKKSPVIKSCVRDRAEDVFKKIMDMLEKGEKQALQYEEENKNLGSEGRAKKIEARLRAILKFIMGKKSSAQSTHTSAHYGFQVFVGILLTILLRSLH